MEKYSYLKINRLDDEENCCLCNESKREYKVFKPVTDPFWINSTVCGRKPFSVIFFC